eukprot:1140253-Pelagomonas_calceolata.AAC.1
MQTRVRQLAVTLRRDGSEAQHHCGVWSIECAWYNTAGGHGGGSASCSLALLARLSEQHTSYSTRFKGPGIVQKQKGGPAAGMTWSSYFV